MELGKVTQVLSRMAPLELAEDWDNVGLLLAGQQTAAVDSILLTIDLTEAVLQEAIARGAALIVAYHPPIFGGLKRIVGATAPERVVIRALAAGISVYSPHTALDTVEGGVNDWLCAAFGKGKVRPIEPRDSARSAREGAGRGVLLMRPMTLDAAVRRVKRHLKLSVVRLARSKQQRIQSVMVCAGAGGGLLSGKQADLMLTGEMRHHDILAANAQGTSVILTDHTNCERGYLPVFAKRLRQELRGKVRIVVSREDRDPLEVV